jgi:hypothetical protein
MFNSKLPLWDRAIFVDWNGVLSNDLFWASILSNVKHPLRPGLRTALQRIFDNSELVNEWMRGTLSSRQIIDELNLALDKRFSNTFLERRLLQDCGRMLVNAALIAFLGDVAGRAFIVLATDNMDCFFQQISISRCSRRTRSLLNGNLQLRHIGSRFDDVLCSSALGTLKSDNPIRFFGDWLYRHALSFSQALLLDDSETTCRIFERSGGTAIRVLPSDLEAESRIRTLVYDWLGHDVLS